MNLKRYVWSCVRITCTYNSFYYNYIYTDLLYLSKHFLQIPTMAIPSLAVLAITCLWISSTNALEILWVEECVHDYLGINFLISEMYLAFCPKCYVDGSGLFYFLGFCVRHKLCAYVPWSCEALLKYAIAWGDTRYPRLSIGLLAME